MKRAIQTADMINKYLHVAYQEIGGFVEIDMGDYEGKRHSDILDKHSQTYQKWIADETLPIPGGESFIDVFNRVKPGVDQILNSSFRYILVVGHAIVNRAILAHLLKMSPMSARKFRMRNCAYSKILIYDLPLGNQIIVDSWNVTSHLDNFP
jgi:broad specificity phosphatase PhoE